MLTLCNSWAPPAFSLASTKQLRFLEFTTPVLLSEGRRSDVASNADGKKKIHDLSLYAATACRLGTHRKSNSITTAATSGGGDSVSELDDNVRKLLQALLWTAEGVYIIWLFLLPYAPVSIHFSFWFG